MKGPTTAEYCFAFALFAALVCVTCKAVWSF